ncbi:MFS transporter [Nocardioides sp. zg-ZUI104]|uniref:MFS transporter n=1 Tax=Nocardioides faecalis TaxID=2803858 RepID=UPI001BCE3B6C|nr:MFS transporter [Nocardioides faecalis]MBS4752760.1 MFS transporter [Nocardioides faecalis]
MTLTSDVPAPTAPTPGRTASHPTAVLLVLSLSTFAIVVMQSMVMPSLANISAALDVTTVQGSWLITANLLAAAVFTPLFGSLGDALGRKRILLVVLALTTLGSVVVATAGGLGVALVGRVLQGTGMAAMPLAIGVIRSVFPAEKVPSSVALLSALTGVGAGAGLLFSGLLLKAGMSGQGMFWLAALVTAGGFVGAATLIHLAEHQRTDFHLDVAGLLTLSGGLVCLVLGINRGPEWGWTSGSVLGLFAGSVVLLAAWLFSAGRAKQPLVDITMMRHPVVLVSNLTAFILGAGMFSAFVLVIQWVQTPGAVGYGFGTDALGAGLTLLPLTLGTLVAAAAVSALIKRVGPKWPLVLGAAVATLTYVFMLVWHTEHWHFYVATGLMGLGLGLSMGAIPTLLNNSVAPEQTSIVNGVNATLRSIGGSIGTTVASAILAAHAMETLPLPTENGYLVAFAVSGGICALAVVAALLLPYRHQRTAPEGIPA